MVTKDLSFSPSTVSVGWWHTVDNERHQPDSRSSPKTKVLISPSCLKWSLMVVATQSTHPQDYPQWKGAALQRVTASLQKQDRCAQPHRPSLFPFFRTHVKGQSLYNLQMLCCSHFFVPLCLFLFLHCYNHGTSREPSQNTNVENIFISESTD